VAAAVESGYDPEQQIAWEARWRPRVAIAAFASAIFILGTEFWNGVIFRDAPDGPGYLESLQRALEPGPLGEAPSQRIPAFEFYSDNAAQIIAASVVRAIGFVALGLVIAFLAAAVRPRREGFRRLAGVTGLVGAVLAAISTVCAAVGSVSAINSVLDGDRTVESAGDIASNTLLVMSQILGLSTQPAFSQLLLGLGLLFVALNAMRVGLLTKFLGILGVITGVLVVIPLGPLPVVQSFWLLALGFLFLGRGRGGLPPAWRTGQAEPWPTAQELAEARRAQADARRPKPEPEPEAAEPAAAGRPHPASKKRKRKRRD
jgi:hypothetical protein